MEGESHEEDGVFDIFTEVLTKILAHIDEEESIIFPMLRAVLRTDELNAVPHAPTADGATVEQEPEVIDIAAAEREATDAAGSGGNGKEAENGGSSRGRFKLRRR